MRTNHDIDSSHCSSNDMCQYLFINTLHNNTHICFCENATLYRCVVCEICEIYLLLFILLDMICINNDIYALGGDVAERDRGANFPIPGIIVRLALKNCGAYRVQGSSWVINDSSSTSINKYVLFM